MAFYGCTFSFDGVSCEKYGMIIYNVGSAKQDSTKFATSASILEDRTATRYRSIFYGTTVNEPLSFPLVFGLNPDLYEGGAAFDRSDFQKIAAWLTGRNQYCWLTIDQADLHGARYRCFIRDLNVIDRSLYPCAFSCSVICDSPYAYLPPKTYSYQVNGLSTVNLYSKSSMSSYYYPRIEIQATGSGDLSIVNQSDSNHIFSLSGMASAPGVIQIDCENSVMTCTTGVNLYQYSNFKFPRLVRGTNQLVLTGAGTFSFICEFPVNIGS